MSYSGANSPSRASSRSSCPCPSSRNPSGRYDDEEPQVTEALRSIALALGQMQEAMLAMNAKMSHTDDSIRGVAQRLKAQGQAVHSLHSRMNGLEEKASKAPPCPRPCPPDRESCVSSGVGELLRGDGPCCAPSERILGLMLLKAAQGGRLKYVRRLLQAGVDPNVTHRAKWTPLHLAAAKGCAPVVSYLLRRGAKVDAKNCFGFTALHIAAFHDYSGRCARALLAAGADADARNRSGRAPLHYAAEAGNVAVTRALMAAGANQAARDDRDRVPYDVAKTVCVRRLLRPKSPVANCCCPGQPPDARPSRLVPPSV